MAVTGTLSVSVTENDKNLTPLILGLAQQPNAAIYYVPGNPTAQFFDMAAPVITSSGQLMFTPTASAVPAGAVVVLQFRLMGGGVTSSLVNVTVAVTAPRYALWQRCVPPASPFAWLMWESCQSCFMWVDHHDLAYPASHIMHIMHIMSREVP